MRESWADPMKITRSSDHQTDGSVYDEKKASPKESVAKTKAVYEEDGGCMVQQ